MTHGIKALMDIAAENIDDGICDPIIARQLRAAAASMGERTDNELRSIWREAGGSFHGPRVETGTMPEEKLLPFLRSYLAPPPPAVPDGYVVVPAEPTEAMLSGLTGPGGYCSIPLVDAYKALLAAAPEQPNPVVPDLIEGLARKAESSDIDVEVTYDTGAGSPVRFEHDISENVASWLREQVPTTAPEQPKADGRKEKARPAVPEGYVLVPVELTPSLYRVGIRAAERIDSGRWLPQVWSAIIAEVKAEALSAAAATEQAAIDAQQEKSHE